MTDRKDYPETIDEKDLYEDIDEEEMYELIQEERRKAFRQHKEEKSQNAPSPGGRFGSLLCLWFSVPYRHCQSSLTWQR